MKNQIEEIIKRQQDDELKMSKEEFDEVLVNMKSILFNNKNLIETLFQSCGAVLLSLEEWANVDTDGNFLKNVFVIPDKLEGQLIYKEQHFRVALLKPNENKRLRYESILLERFQQFEDHLKEKLINFDKLSLLDKHDIIYAIWRVIPAIVHVALNESVGMYSMNPSYKKLMMQYNRQFQELIDNYPQQLPKYLKLISNSRHIDKFHAEFGFQHLKHFVVV